MSNKFRLVDEEGNFYPDKREKKVGDFLSIPDDLQLVEPDDIARTSLITVKLHMKGVQANDRTATLQIGSTGYYKRKAGQFIYGKQNLHNGALGIIPKELDGFLSSNDIPAFDIDENQISSYFLLQFLGRENFYRNLEKIAAGTGSKRIAPKALFEVTIPLPSLAEQVKIAEFFSALDERIALTADKVKLLKEQKQGYLQKIFAQELVFTDDNGDQYPEWEKKELSEISTIKRGASPRPIAEKRWFSETSDTGWVRISDVSSSGKYLLKTTQYLSPAGVERSVKVEEGSLILSIAGSVGKPAITKVPVCIHDGFILFKNLTENAEYVYYFLEYSRKGWDKLSQSGSQANLNSEIVGNLSIPLPSLLEQQKVVEFFSALDEQIELIENKLALLKEQKKGYLQGIFG